MVKGKVVFLALQYTMKVVFRGPSCTWRQCLLNFFPQSRLWALSLVSSQQGTKKIQAQLDSASVLQPCVPLISLISCFHFQANVWSFIFMFSCHLEIHHLSSIFICIHNSEYLASHAIRNQSTLTF